MQRLPIIWTFYFYYLCFVFAFGSVVLGQNYNILSVPIIVASFIWQHFWRLSLIYIVYKMKAMYCCEWLELNFAHLTLKLWIDLNELKFDDTTICIDTQIMTAINWRINNTVSIMSGALIFNNNGSTILDSHELNSVGQEYEISI